MMKEYPSSRNARMKDRSMDTISIKKILLRSFIYKNINPLEYPTRRIIKPSLMKNKIPISRTIIILLIFLTPIILIFVFTDILSSNNPGSAQMDEIIQQGINYLNDQINPEISLLREAPIAAPNKYWLTNDNSLAAFTFDQFGQPNTSKMLIQSIKKYGSYKNNFIEVLMGDTIAMPPHVAEAVLVKKIGDLEIWTEVHPTGARYEDWQEYANLSFLMALNYDHLDRRDAAQKTILNCMQMFDGTGFKDKAFSGTYETYKLALALYSANKLNVELENENEILEILLKMQDENGGFHTHYDEYLNPSGDTNTETTSFALLALGSLVYQ